MIAALAMAMVGSGAQAAGWSPVERVGSYGEGSLLVTPKGRVQLAVRGEDGLFHLVRRADGSWARTRLTRDVLELNDGGFVDLHVHAHVPALARDSQTGNLALAYYEAVEDGSTGGCSGGLEVERRIDGAWTAAEPVRGVDGCTGGYPSLVSRGGELWLASGVWRFYGMWQNSALLWTEDGGWHGRLVQPSNAMDLDGPSDAVVAVAPDGRIHLAYSATGSVRHASTTDPTASLDREPVAYTAHRAAGVAMVLDRAGRPVIAWSGPNGASFARQTAAGTWQVEQLPWATVDLALALDAHGRPHLLLAQGTAGVRHAWRTPDGWRSERIDTRSSRMVAGLAFDRSGRMIAAWQHGQSWKAPTMYLRRLAG